MLNKAELKGKTRIQLQSTMAVLSRRMAVMAFVPVGIVLALGMILATASAVAQASAAPGSLEGLLAGQPWEYGPFVNGGFGTGNRDTYKFLSAGIHVGKVLTPPIGPGILRGQFELAAEAIPLWQAYTPKYLRANCYESQTEPLNCTNLFPTGGTYTGLSFTPAILRWNLRPGRRIAPWIQGAGGLIWTTHKFPPVGPYPVPGHLGTSVFNYTPQFGLGMHYFLKPRQSISISANAVHISNASMGDSNPGVNASVQLSIGYTWWK